ncbi:MAG: flagellar biosynthesis anti-sigma factor FlgM [Oscillospiraceae bacterium]|jgi:anti-sigma28 factor (negative regulator of flagellin synthesis)|nr:flagellar biosynthesis anti-sigma factor FlgM [Oscillospiraceae bacterium]
MEIKNLNSRMINAYKGVSGTQLNKGKDKPGEISGKAGDNFDKVEFDFGRAAEAAKSDITAAVAADAGAARIEQLQEAYEGGGTPVTSGQLADSILA